jgi:3-isopropylmalate dehydratase small subunit
VSAPDDPGRLPEWETPLPTLTGRAWAFGTRLAAHDVLPARFATANPAAARRHLFADLDAGLAARLAPGDVVVAEEHDDAAGPALAALQAAGVVALVGRTFPPTLERAALAAGIVTVALDAPHFVHTGDRLRIDLEAAKVVNLSSGDRAAIRNLDERRRAALRAMFEARDDAS